jgi:hypothetical protein
MILREICRTSDPLPNMVAVRLGANPLDFCATTSVMLASAVASELPFSMQTKGP